MTRKEPIVMTTDQTAAERQLRAVELRTIGLGFDAIARQLGYAGRQSAHKAYQRGLAQLPDIEDRESLRQLEALRLDALQAAVWTAATAGDVAASAAVVKIMEHRAKMFGLYAPTRLDHKVSDNLDAEINALIEEFVKLGGLDGSTVPLDFREPTSPEDS